MIIKRKLFGKLLIIKLPYRKLLKSSVYGGLYIRVSINVYRKFTQQNKETI